MADDSTWLKKNLTNYPLKRNLKTSLFCTVPHQEMDLSLLSNPERAEKPDVFIPRMLQNRSRMSRSHQFKVPKLPSAKPVLKKEDAKQPEMPRKSFVAPRKSFLPVPATKSEKEPPKLYLTKPSIMPRTSALKLNVKRKCMQRMIELSEEKKASQSQVVSSDNSVIRSILKKKRASLRKSQASGSQPKAKKVLFDGLEDSFVDEKENYRASSPMNTDSEHILAPEPPFSSSLSFSIAENNSQVLEDDSEEPELKPPDNVTLSSILEIFSKYKDKMSHLQKIHNKLENCMNSILRYTFSVHNEFQSLKKDLDDICGAMEKLRNEQEEKLKEIIRSNNAETTSSRKRTPSEMKKTNKLRLSDRSKAIQGSSRKRKSLPMREILQNLDDVDTFASWKNNG